jgi:hypothetical protein
LNGPADNGAGIFLIGDADRGVALFLLLNDVTKEGPGDLVARENKSAASIPRFDTVSEAGGVFLLLKLAVAFMKLGKSDLLGMSVPSIILGPLLGRSSTNRPAPLNLPAPTFGLML